MHRGSNLFKLRATEVYSQQQAHSTATSTARYMFPGLEQEQPVPAPPLLPTLGEGRSSELGDAARFMDILNWRSLAIISSRYSQPARARWGTYADTRWVWGHAVLPTVQIARAKTIHVWEVPFQPPP